MNTNDPIEILHRAMWLQFCQDERILLPGTNDTAEILVNDHAMRITFQDLLDIRLAGYFGIVVRFQSDSGLYTMAEGVKDNDPPRLWKVVYTAVRSGRANYYQHPCNTSRVS